MNILKNRKTAVVVFFAVVIAFSLIGGHRSLQKACSEVENTFYSETFSVYTTPAEQLDRAADYANRLLSIVRDDISQDVYDAIADSRSALLDALETKDISAACDASTTLEIAVLALDGTVITNNYDDYDAVRSDLLSALSTADTIGYNDYVDKFCKTTLKTFPANLIAALTGVDMPEKFE